MPACFGLYAAFPPVMVAALWGSSNQLGTGPVAVVSLPTASALAPLAAPGSDAFVALAIVLALLVGDTHLPTLGMGVTAIAIIWVIRRKAPKLPGALIAVAVPGLINFAGIKHAWMASRHDGIAAVATFVATLAFAPHLDTGIMIGAGLAIGLYLHRTMSPRVAVLGRHGDGSLRDASAHNLPPSEIVTAVGFDGRLYFANVSCFEDSILEAVAANPKAP